MWLAIAGASLLLVLFALDDGRGPRGPEGHDGRQVSALWSAAYKRSIEVGFGSAGYCDPQANLGEECREAFGHTLSFDGAEGSEVLGVCRGLSIGGCVGVVMKVASSPVLVFVVSSSADPMPMLGGLEGLRLWRRDLGALVLYALAATENDALASLHL